MTCHTAAAYGKSIMCCRGVCCYTLQGSQITSVGDRIQRLHTAPFKLRPTLLGKQAHVSVACVIRPRILFLVPVFMWATPDFARNSLFNGKLVETNISQPSFTLVLTDPPVRADPITSLPRMSSPLSATQRLSSTRGVRWRLLGNE